VRDYKLPPPPPAPEEDAVTIWKGEAVGPSTALEHSDDCAITMGGGCDCPADLTPSFAAALTPERAARNPVSALETTSSPVSDLADPFPSSLPRACWSCGNWSERDGVCLKWNQTPPAEVQREGCEAWTEDMEIPF
jgi:hypothetical protein